MGVCEVVGSFVLFCFVCFVWISFLWDTINYLHAAVKLYCKTEASHFFSS